MANGLVVPKAILPLIGYASAAERPILLAFIKGHSVTDGAPLPFALTSEANGVARFMLNSTRLIDIAFRTSDQIRERGVQPKPGPCPTRSDDLFTLPD